MVKKVLKVSIEQQNLDPLILPLIKPENHLMLLSL
jgi:hypothetical protein